VWQVTEIHPSALEEVIRRKKDPALVSEDDHKLMLSYVMAACHSISILGQTDDATDLVLRLNSEIIPDPSAPEIRQSEAMAVLEERSSSMTLEELVVDTESEETILVKVVDSDTDDITVPESLESPEAPEPILDLPSTTYRDFGQEKVQHLVGDSLEIQVFQQSGWRYCVRPSAPPNISEILQKGGNFSSFFVDGAFDDFNIWRHPQLASYVDTVMLPPKTVKSDRNSSAIAILRRFDFDSDLRRMGAIIRTLPNPDYGGAVDGEGGQHFLLVKGAPESIKDICTTETIPHDFEEQLQRLTLAGYRVLACGTRSLEHLTEGSMLKGTRDDLEVQLVFTGLLVMENRLKEETTGFLREYRQAGFRQLMVTGDNPLVSGLRVPARSKISGSETVVYPWKQTAVAVAKMSGPVFLSGWRRAMLVDVQSAVPGGETKLVVRDILDPSLKWDLVEFLQANFDEETLLLPDTGSAGTSARPPVASGERPVATPPLPGPGAGGVGKSPSIAEIDFVCTGRSFGALFAVHTALREDEPPDRKSWTAFELVLLKCNVFARMSPQNKQELMRALQDLEYVVCMTGDGANDSGTFRVRATPGLTLVAI
jgi:magnesium-transporting ATPase (P-type)